MAMAVCMPMAVWMAHLLTRPCKVINLLSLKRTVDVSWMVTRPPLAHQAEGIALQGRSNMRSHAPPRARRPAMTEQGEVVAGTSTL